MKKFSNHHIIFLFIAFLTFLHSESEAQTIRIMPLGNSITRGDMCVNGSIYGCVNIADADAVGYRNVVYDLLDSAKYDIDFVGSESSGGDLMADTDHAGFSGITSDELADLMETGTSSHTGPKTVGPYLNTYNPDIIFLHIGTNDVLGGDYTIDGVERILNAVDDYETTMVDSVIVFISTVLSTRDAPCGTDPGVTEYNDNLKILVAERIAAGDKLHLLDMECDAGLDYTLDMADEVHPNQEAYDKMGQLWFTYVNAYFHPDIPEAPTDMTFSLVTASSMRVNWVDNSDNEDYFVVERSLTKGSDYVDVGTPTTNYFDDSGLSAEVEYFYRVRAENDSGPSGYLSGSEITLPNPPADPTNMTFSSVTENSIQVNWSDNSLNEDNFEIQRSLTGTGGWTNLGEPTVNYYEYTGLAENTEYFFRVRAVNAGGASNWLTGSETTLLSAPDQPSNMTFSLVTESSMRVNWVDNADNEDNFQIQRSLTGTGGWIDLGEPVLNYYDYGGLDENTEYFFRVRAVNDGGVSDWLTGSNSTLLLAPDPPTDMTFSMVTTSTIRVNWVDNSDNEENFEIQRSLTGTGGWTDLAKPTLNYYFDSGLDENTEYFYRVRAVNATANSAWLEGSDTTLLSIPTAPDRVRGTASDICTVELTWRDLSDNEEGFEIQRSDVSSGGFVPLDIVAANTEAYTDSDTENNSTYYYRIRVFNDAGEALSSVGSVSVSVSLSGGVIAENQEICPEGDPDQILNVVSPSGGSNDFTYQWQSRIAPAEFSDIAGATDLSYDPPGPEMFTKEYQRVSTVECGSVESNTVTITVDDMEAPEFTFCPTDTVIEIERDQIFATAVPHLPIVTDNCEISALTWTMSGVLTGNSPAIGINYVESTDFPLGVTRINYFAEDLMGNSASCSFNVSIETKDPEILEVSIPNGIMKIGQLITATISVAEDGGSEYVLVSGTIGGYPLQDLQRINSTTYMANFLIVEGGNSYEALEDIPVENLVVSDGLTASEPYATPISQDEDLLDAELPVVISADLVAGDYKIGDQVVIDIETDGPGYMLDPLSTMNGLAVSDPNIAFVEIGEGIYQLIYMVEEGNEDVAAGEFEASLVFEKPSGNIGDPHTFIGNTGLVTIDANAPLVTRLEVPDEEVGVGGTVLVTITADGTDYTLATGTLINGIPMGSDQVTFIEISNGLYALSYEVSENDNVVAPGELEMSIILTDEAGNDGEAFEEIEENELEIYTQLPLTHMVTLPEICEGEEAELIVYLVGRKPFSFELFDGENTVLYEDIDTGTYNLVLTPLETTEYTVPLIIDRNGVENSGSGSVTVSVNEITPVKFTNLETGYNVETPAFKLSADISGGVFSGPGVNSATGYFDPGTADTTDSPHTLYYTYTNATGCVSMDSALVFILGADGDIYIPYAQVCDDAEPFNISASNVAGVTGTFALFNSNGIEVAGLTDNDDNTAVVDPALLTEGVYTVEYGYLDGVMLYVREDFELLYVAQPVILSPSVTSYCQNSGPVTLLANDPTAVFAGSGVTGSPAEGYIFDPSQAPVGETTISCLISNDAGCEKSETLVVEVYEASEVLFTVKSSCLPLEGGWVYFDNQSSSKLAVETWRWDFGDPLSGAENYSSEIDPVHFYQAPGDWSISLSATTYDGCVSTYQLDTVLSSSPTTDFTWMSDCYLDGQGVEFINLTTGGLTPIESVTWSFMFENGDVIDRVTAESITDTVEYQFPRATTYLVELQSVNQGGCADTVIKTVELRPTYKLTADGYSEAFDQSNGGWTIESEDENASWVWGIPDFTDYTPGGPGFSWYTHLPEGNAGYLENSWVQSPCFDFSDMDRPMINLDIMKSFVPNVNGAVLQYMDNRNEGWHTVGANSQGINWYNSYNIFNLPGGSPVGWGLDVFNPDTDWVSASQDLSSLKDKDLATLRLAIATNGAQGIGNQGFAFDNLIISEKTKLAVLEHFTNSSDAMSAVADIIVDSYITSNKSEVVDLQYHTAYPGDDPMNQNNPEAASVRAGNLGVGLVPYAVLDGGASESYRYDFSDAENSPEDDAVNLLSLEIPAFDIDLEVDWTETMLTTSATVTCMADSYEEYIQLYIVVLETSITSYEGANGDTEFRNVVLKMLPTPAGKLLGQNWYKGVSMSLDNLWVFEPYVEDVEDLAVVAFVQDRNTKEILQAAVNYKTVPTGIGDRFADLRDIQVYPNPARDFLYVNLGSRAEKEGILEVYDLSGRMVMNMETQPGYQIFNLDVQDLTKGMYMIRLMESGVVVGHSKFIKTE